MTFNQLSLKNIILALVAFIAILVISHKLLGLRTKAFIHDKYINVAKEMQFTTQSYIDAKQKSVLFIALSLANDPRFSDAIMSSDHKGFELTKFSESLRLNTQYKNVWIQISDNQGKSIYRSWTNKRGDDISKVRQDIAEMILDPQIRSTISTGIFDMTFKSMVPLFKEDKFIGTIEVISKFNSISQQLSDNGFELVLLVDKAYKDQIAKPFTKMFLGDYYIANVDASKENQAYIQQYGLEELIKSNKIYITDKRNNRFITKYIQKDVNGNDMGYFILFQPLDNIELEYIYFFHNAILIFISLIIIGIYLLLQLISSRHNKEKAELRNQILSKEVEDKDLELEKQHELLQNVINGIDQSVMVIDKEYNVLLANDAAKQYSDEKIMGNSPLPKCYELTHHKEAPCSGDEHQCPLRETLELNKSVQKIHRHHTPSGEEHFIELTTTPLYDKNNEAYAVVELGHNITEHLNTQRILEKQKNKLDFQAHYDALTSLPNRVLFLDRLKHAMQIAKRDKSKVALIFIDLDHFKEINDSIGHHAGDFILKECAKRLQGLLREVDTVSRFGGDEFTIILERVEDENELIDIIQLILEKLQEPYIYDFKKLYSGASIGISIYPENGNTHQELLKNADAAMYKAKENGRNSYSFYTSSMTEHAHERVMLEAKLREAIKHDKFSVYYQPFIDLKTHKVIGYEALLRWVESDGKLIYPDTFISIIEQTGLIIDIGKAILEKVFLQASKWRSAGMAYEKISINISAKQLKDPEFLPHIEALLERTKCDPDWIEFEIIESFIIGDIIEAVKVLESIKSIGISISLDDFGTGYSSLSYLKKLPISKLKIDKSFIDDIPFDENDKIITKTIINLAKDLNLSVLAEGVETKEQEEFLLENGCSLAQGYLYDVPLRAEEIDSMSNDGAIDE